MLVAQTGWGRDEDRQRAREAGFDHHLVKPIDHQILRRILDGSEELPQAGSRAADQQQL
jgi:CheY-like chemotaxis protein